MPQCNSLHAQQFIKSCLKVNTYNFIIFQETVVRDESVSHQDCLRILILNKIFVAVSDKYFDIMWNACIHRVAVFLLGCTLSVASENMIFAVVVGLRCYVSDVCYHYVLVVRLVVLTSSHTSYSAAVM